MKCLKALAFVPVVLVAWATSAQAQEVQPADISPPFYLEGIGGAALTHDFSDVAPAFAVEFGERLHRQVYAYANLRYINDLMSEQMKSSLEAASEGTGLNLSGRDRGLTFTIGAKYMFPPKLRFRPYVGGGAGAINLKRYIANQTFGDLISYDGIFNVGESSATFPMGEAIIGFSGAASNRTYLDVSYRHGWAFNTPQSLEFGQLTVGVGFTF